MFNAARTVQIKTSPGSPFPLGASWNDGWWNFAVYATNEILALITEPYPINSERIRIENLHKTGDIWHIALESDAETLLWGWEVANNTGTLASIAVDPYARFLLTNNTWKHNRWEELHRGALLCLASRTHEVSRPGKSLRPKSPVIYEAHVRGFTASANVQHPGTYVGFIEKLDYLKKMGVNVIELMPIFEFDESEWKKIHPETKKTLCNFWGYSPLHFFCPMQRYGTSNDPFRTAHEVRELTRACHEAGMAVVLDVVYNHTGEGSAEGPSLSLKSLAEDTYYIKNPDGTLSNYSGCGNTLNANHPVVLNLIMDSLRHWVLEYHVDGFRFDLASCLTRDCFGRPMDRPPLLEAIVSDPILRNSLLIAEPWDAGGLYQTGKLFCMNQRGLPKFSEWNDRFRDDIRIFLKGTDGFSGHFAQRLCGSEDIYTNGSPANSVNYITAHDGFSLHDLVSFNTKHNLENGEHEQDGMVENFSWNCGIEGETRRAAIIHLRERQVKNFLIALLLSRGIPMLLMGDEALLSKGGNNNSWCHDAPINFLPWKSVLQGFISVLLTLRNNSSCFHSHRFLTPKDVDWHGTKLSSPRWDEKNRLVAFCLRGEDHKQEVYLAFNASPCNQNICIPPADGNWHLIVNTSATESKKSFFPLDESPIFPDSSAELLPYSSIVLASSRVIKNARSTPSR